MSNQVAFSFEQILDWVEGRLSPSEVQTMQAQWGHATEEQQATYRWAQLFRRVSQQTVLATPPPHVHKELMRRFAEHAESKRPPTLLRRLVAALSFDSGLQPAMIGLRSALPDSTQEGASHQWVFASEDADVILNLQPLPAHAGGVLFGQILSNRDEIDASDFALQVLQNEQEIALTVADDLGEFRFAALPVGIYQLNLSSAQAEIELPVIQI